MYPNPAKDFVNISFSKNQSNVSITIFNVLGQKVYAKFHKEVSQKLKIKFNGKAGFYLVNIKGENNLNYNQKIIKQ